MSDIPLKMKTLLESYVGYYDQKVYALISKRMFANYEKSLIDSHIDKRIACVL